MKKLPALAGYGKVHSGIVQLLESARRAAARSVNVLMTASYWEVGRRIVEFEQGGKGRAEYGQQLLKRFSVDLTGRFGRGFGLIKPSANAQFLPLLATRTDISDSVWQIFSPSIHQTPSDKLRAQTASAKSAGLAALAARFPLPWSAYVQLLSVKSVAARAFYETEALRCGWSVRQLNRQIGSQFYERVALSRNKAAMLEISYNKWRPR